MDCSELHPKFVEMLSSGVADEDHIRKTFQLYLDICEVRQWWNVRIHPSVELNRIFISGRPARGLDREFVLALGADQSLSPSQVHSYIQRLKDFSSVEVKGLTVALVDADTNSTFYKMSSGLIPPLHLVGESKYKGGNSGRSKPTDLVCEMKTQEADTG